MFCVLGYQESKVAIHDKFTTFRFFWYDVFGDMTTAINYALLDAWNLRDPEIQPVVYREFFDAMEGEQRIRDWYQIARFKDPVMIEAIAHCRFCPVDIIEDIVMWQKTGFLVRLVKRNPNTDLTAIAVKEIARRSRVEAAKKQSKKPLW